MLLHQLCQTWRVYLTERRAENDSEGFSGWKRCFHSLFDWQKIDFPTGSTGGRALLLFSHLSRIFWSRCLSISKNVLLVSFKEAHQYHFLCVHKCFHHFHRAHFFDSYLEVIL